MTTLLPCPFCNAIEPALTLVEDFECQSIMCLRCATSGPVIDVSDEDRHYKDAAEAWNFRVDPRHYQ